MEFPAMNQDKINEIISQLGIDDIKPDEIDAFIGDIRKCLIEKTLEGEFGIVQEMDDADLELEISTEPVLHRIRRKGFCRPLKKCPQNSLQAQS